jgi:hypothetical protein
MSRARKTAKRKALRSPFRVKPLTMQEYGSAKLAEAFLAHYWRDGGEDTARQMLEYAIVFGTDPRVYLRWDDAAGNVVFSPPPFGCDCKEPL